MQKTSQTPTSNPNVPTQTFGRTLDEDLIFRGYFSRFLFGGSCAKRTRNGLNKLDAASAKAWLDWWKGNTGLDLEPELEIAVPAVMVQLAKQRENARREKILV